MFLQVSYNLGCFLLAEEILKFSRSVLLHGVSNVGCQAVASLCWLSLGTDAAKLLPRFVVLVA
jgi:hypothetical protein